MPFYRTLTRYPTIKFILVLFATAAFAPVLAAAMPAAGKTSSQPNIILIFADDLGWKDKRYAPF